MSFFNTNAGPSQTMFGSTMGSSLTGTSLFGQSTAPTTFGATTVTHNPNKDIEVQSPPDDSISGLAFSPPTLQQNFLVSGSWDNQIRCWEVTGAVNAWQAIPKAQQTHSGPVLDVRFSDVRFYTKVF